MFILPTVTIILLVIYHRVSSKSSSNEEAEKCHVLVFGGGGDRGAWSGGAIAAIVEFLDTPYKIVSGTSIGAINAGLFSQSKIGEEEKGVGYIENFWKTVRREDLYINWPGGIVQGFLSKPALFDTSVALKHTFSHYFNMTKFRNTDRKTYIGTTDLETGEFVNFDYTFPDIALAVAASRLHTDGGASGNAPVTTPMEKCHELYPGMDVVVDVVYCLSRIQPPHFLKSHTLTPFVLIEAGLGIVNDILLNDLQYAQEAFPEAEVNVYMPGTHLDSLFITFDHTEILKMYEIGYNEAKATIQSRNN